jgi:hypothetical protein
MSEVKKLDFSKFQSNFKSDEELNAALAKGGESGGRFFQPGLYELEIVEAKFKTDDAGNVVFAKDPSWVTVEYTLKGVDSEKTIRNSLLVPLRNEMYTAQGGKPTTFVYQKFKEFCNALGMDVSRAALSSVLTKFFTDPSTQVGGRVKATIGYQNAHSVMIRKKTDEGGLLLGLVDAKGTAIINDKGEQVTGVNDEQLKLFCKTHSPEIRFNGFTNIIKVEPSEHPGKMKDAVGPAKGIFD